MTSVDEAEAEIQKEGGQPFLDQGQSHLNDPSALDLHLQIRDDRGPALGRPIAPIKNQRRANTDFRFNDLCRPCNRYRVSLFSSTILYNDLSTVLQISILMFF